MHYRDIGQSPIESAGLNDGVFWWLMIGERHDSVMDTMRNIEEEALEAGKPTDQETGVVPTLLNPF